MVLKRLAPLIETKVREEVNLLLSTENEAQSLSSKLKKVHEVLADAEQRVLADRSVERWLQKLHDIVYEIDDALDEWEVGNIKQRLEESEDISNQESEEADSWEKKVSTFLESICLCFKHTVQRRSIALDIKGINQRLDSITKENDNEFKFVPNVGRESGDFKRVLSTSFVDVSEVHGRGIDMGHLMSVLLSESCSGRKGQGYGNVKIVSIVGAGGMGRTTLAQLLFNDVAVKNRFEEKIWVCVSDPFDDIKIAIATKGSSDLSELETLLHCVKECVSGKKFLLVLDDVWIEDGTMRKLLKVSLQCGATGSRSLVTTRKEKVAKVMDSSYMHLLVPLKDMYCWSILGRSWMVQGFLSYSTSSNAKDMELMGREYFDDLAMRSFFQDFVKDDDDRITGCKMHDMVHDFPQFLTTGECCLIDQFYGADIAPENNKARHLSVNLRDAASFDSICEYERLRTLNCGYIHPPNLFTRLKRVRLMSVGHCNFQNIPEEIGDLIHLRYLDLSGNVRLAGPPRKQFAVSSTC